MQRLWLLVATSLTYLSATQASRLLGGPTDDSCGPCMPLANSVLGSSCTDPVCVVQAFAKQKDHLMAKPDGMEKLMGVYACAQKNKCNLDADSAAGKEAKSLGLLNGEVPSFVQLSKSDDNCTPCLPMANAVLGSSCTDPVCVVQAFAKQKDNLMAKPDGMEKLMGVYACAQKNKCNLEADSAAGKEAKSLGLLNGQEPSFLQLSKSASALRVNSANGFLLRGDEMTNNQCKVICQRFGFKALGDEFANIKHPNECVKKCDVVYPELIQVVPMDGHAGPHQSISIAPTPTTKAGGQAPPSPVVKR